MLNTVVQRHNCVTSLLSFPLSADCFVLFGLPFDPAPSSWRGKGFLEVFLLEISYSGLDFGSGQNLSTTAKASLSIFVNLATDMSK